MKLLFVSSRNIYNSGGEMRLIKTRSSVMRKTFGIDSDFICYRNKGILNAPQEVIDPSSEFTLFTYSMLSPLSVFHEKRKLRKKVADVVDCYDAVILSGELVLSLVKDIKKISDIPVIYDIHGVCDELKEFKSESVLVNAKRKFIYHLFQRLESKYLNKFDAAFAVTRELKEHVAKKYNADNLKYFIVPCAKSKFVLNPDVIRANRIKYRQKYGISDNEILFIYSGGYSPWQCVDETIELFGKIRKAVPQAKLLILSGDKDKINTGDSDGVILDSLLYSEVDSALCAGDYAFMLRGDYVTNHVAFPNKYCEYLASGMKVISSPYLYTIAESIKVNGVGAVVKSNESDREILDYVGNSPDWGTDFPTRQRMLDEICFENTLVPFFEFLKENADVR